MRVLLNTRPLLFVKTGIGYYVSNLYRELCRSAEVQLVPTIGPSAARRLRFMSGLSGKLRTLLGKGVLKVSVPAGDFLIARAENSGAPPPADLYHETNYDPIPAGPWKTVANVYDLSFVLYPRLLPEAVLLKCRANLGNVAAADRIIVNTSSVKVEAESLLGIDGSRIDVIPLAPSSNYHAVPDRKAARRRVGKYTRRDFVLCVGTIEPRKNIPVLLRAFGIVRERRPLALVIAGGRGWHYDDILEMPRRLGLGDDVVFTGYVNEQNLLDLYNCASAVVYPSLYEGFGLPVVEAMACGAPLIISDIPSLREVAGDAALAFPPDDHEALAALLERVLRSDSVRRDLSEKALRRAAGYSWERVAALTVATYRKALGS